MKAILRGILFFATLALGRDAFRVRLKPRDVLKTHFTDCSITEIYRMGMNSTKRKEIVLPSVVAITAFLFSLSVPLAIGVAADPLPVPDAFGIYAIADSKLIPLNEGERLPDLPPNFELVVYDKPVAVLSANSYKVRTVNYVRYDVAGDISKGIHRENIAPAKPPPNRYRFISSVGETFPIEVKQFDGKPDMVRLSFKNAFAPGLYELEYGSSAVGFSNAKFGIANAKWTLNSISVDHYFFGLIDGLDFYGSEGRSDLGVYKSARVLDQVLERQRLKLDQQLLKRDQELLANWNGLLKTIRQKPPATIKEIEKTLSDDAKKFGRVRVKLGIFSQASRDFEKQITIARRIMTEGDYDNAEKFYIALRSNTVRDVEPAFAELATDFESTSSLALTALKHDNPSSSMDFAVQALEKCRHPKVLLIVSANYARLGKVDEALFWLKKALESGNVERKYIDATFAKEFAAPELKKVLDEHLPQPHRS